MVYGRETSLADGLGQGSGDRESEPLLEVVLGFGFSRFISLCIQYSVCMYTCTPEEGLRSHYRWL